MQESEGRHQAQACGAGSEQGEPRQIASFDVPGSVQAGLHRAEDARGHDYVSTPTTTQSRLRSYR